MPLRGSVRDVEHKRHTVQHHTWLMSMETTLLMTTLMMKMQPRTRAASVMLSKEANLSFVHIFTSVTRVICVRLHIVWRCATLSDISANIIRRDISQAIIHALTVAKSLFICQSCANMSSLTKKALSCTNATMRAAPLSFLTTVT